jgi:hypothetical protein
MDYSSDESIERRLSSLADEFTDAEEERRYVLLVVSQKNGRQAAKDAVKANPRWFKRYATREKYLDEKHVRWFMKLKSETYMKRAARVLLTLKRSI